MHADTYKIKKEKKKIKPRLSWKARPGAIQHICSK
uniref:Uncharacterized protein n=1 Tax=Rhizophora mucronata TaxID=61149 RepID=A0A2P2NDG5_RHIMU